MLHDLLDLVGHIVEQHSELGDVLAIDGRQKLGGETLDDFVGDVVSLVLDSVNHLHLPAKPLRVGLEVLDDIEQSLRLLASDVGLGTKRFKIVELVLLRHEKAFRFGR